jgi:hypothetical protein
MSEVGQFRRANSVADDETLSSGHCYVVGIGGALWRVVLKFDLRI